MWLVSLLQFFKLFNKLMEAVVSNACVSHAQGKKRHDDGVVSTFDLLSVFRPILDVSSLHQVGAETDEA